MSIDSDRQKLFDDFNKAKADGRLSFAEVAILMSDLGYLAVDVALAAGGTAIGRDAAIRIIKETVDVLYPQLAAISWFTRVLAMVHIIDLKATLQSIAEGILNRELPPPPPETTPTSEVKS